MIMNKIWIGIDNGATGTTGVVSTIETPLFFHNPSVTMQDYTKAKKNITRLDTVAFHDFLTEWKQKAKETNAEIMICMERPMVNPQMFKASEGALRYFEAMWAIIELLQLPVQFIPSTDWQKEILPKGTTGAPALKKASLEIGNRLYPQFKDFKHSDRDGLLIAHWMKKTNM